jgi:hypothetical protein
VPGGYKHRISKDEKASVIDTASSYLGLDTPVWKECKAKVPSDAERKSARKPFSF